ncbi:hypothetical protein CANMA_003319 [Candida margitis]|uniref:uncharacterized protein n=1 Tax=Candida margitis TaxID=1775924 RepID=UPI002227F5BE|nr:uncharacterized protein CANMA_003319 [Candida margitis]KAI5966073.1 hypothetical protein CANMA_003319 [Candida margitis]
MAEYNNRYTTTNAGEHNGKTTSNNCTNDYYYNNSNPSGNNDVNASTNNHYRATSNIAANIKPDAPTEGSFQQGLYQTSSSLAGVQPSYVLHATPIPHPPQHPLMSLPPPITSAMNSQASPSQSINHLYHNRNNNNSIGNSFTSRASPHFQMLGHNRNNSSEHNIQYETSHQYGCGGNNDAAFSHVPQSYMNGYPLSQPKPTLPLPANHQSQTQTQEQQQPPQPRDSQEQLTSNNFPNDPTSSSQPHNSNDKFNSSSYHMGQPSQSNSQFVRQFSHHLNPNYAVNLKFIKDLNTMMNNWSEDEVKARRRLVKFDVSHGDNNTMQMINFEAIKSVDYGVTQAVISCIYWQEKNRFICTSVDIILLLEYLVHQSFGIEEKNRIRRNLQSLKPTTVSRSNKNDRDFFSLIMSMENPRPRNIEKDLKVFNWSDLGKAIAKVMSKYYVVSSPSPGSANLWCNGGHQSHNVPLSGSPAPAAPLAPATRQTPQSSQTSQEGGMHARQSQLAYGNGNNLHHASQPPLHKPSLPPLTSVAPISNSSTPTSTQFPHHQSPQPYGEEIRSSSSAPDLQKTHYSSDSNRRKDFAFPPTARVQSSNTSTIGTPSDSSNVRRQVTPTYHTQESKQQYHHHYHSQPTGFQLPLPPPRLFPSGKHSYSRVTPSTIDAGVTSQQQQQQPVIPRSSDESTKETSNMNSVASFGLLNSAANDSSSFSNKEESSSDSDRCTSKLKSGSNARGLVSSSGQHPPSINFSDSPSPDKEIEGDTSSGSERPSSNDDDDAGSALSGNSKASVDNSDDSGQTNKSNGISNSNSSISSGSKDSSSLFSMQRDSGNSSEESTMSNSVPGSGKLTPLNFNNNNNSVGSLSGTNGGAAATTSSSFPKTSLRALIDPQPSSLLGHKVEEDGEPVGDNGNEDEDGSMEDDADEMDVDDGNKIHNPNWNRDESIRIRAPPMTKKRRRKPQRKMSNSHHQLQNNATSQYFDNKNEKFTSSHHQPLPSLNGGVMKPQLPPISQLLKSEYTSNEASPPSSPAYQSPLAVDDERVPLVKKVHNWKDY